MQVSLWLTLRSAASSIELAARFGRAPGARLALSVSWLAAVGALRGLWLADSGLPWEHTAAKVTRRAVPLRRQHSAALQVGSRAFGSVAIHRAKGAAQPFNREDVPRQAGSRLSSPR